MKNWLIVLFITFCHTGIAQLTSLNQNFNIDCASTSGFPAGWFQYAVTGNQFWTCAPGDGYNNSACIKMDNYTGVYNADSVWLITPKLDLRQYKNIYLNFFDKFSRDGDSLNVSVSSNYPGNAYSPLCDTCSWTQIIVPFSEHDTNWSQHQIDLTPYKQLQLYVSFRYQSTNLSGRIWFLDSIFTTQTYLSVSNSGLQSLPLTIIGTPSPDNIQASYTVPVAGSYTATLLDITGRTLYSKSVPEQAGLQRIVIMGLHLEKGMYILKIGNATCYGVAKTIVQ